MKPEGNLNGTLEPRGYSYADYTGYIDTWKIVT